MAIKSSKKNNSCERIVSPKEKENDLNQNSLRPKFLNDYVWQKNIKKHLSVSIQSAKIRKKSLEHILFYGPPWLWKTTLSNIISSEMWTNLKTTSWPAVEKQADLVSILSNLEAWDILFIDEIHRLRPQIEEILYVAMEDYALDIMVGSWPWAQSVRINLEPFTLVWATTKLSSLSAPLRDRFGNVLKLDFYDNKEIFSILKRSSEILKIDLKDEILEKIASRSRWTPRIANRLLKIIRDYYIIWKDLNNPKTLDEIFDDLCIDELWLDYLDKKYLLNIKDKFNYGPVWLNTLASTLWEEESTLEDVVEPYLLQIGFIERTPRWRKITSSAIEYLQNNN